ncbi:hypothetical protein BGZ63DRAFT_405327 [Mariannaea sp. PMI_226]|nr:hypothetical protein BGZ63DRAFT_405327 [Mariannaea sp. PMI_226]
MMNILRASPRWGNRAESYGAGPGLESDEKDVAAAKANRQRRWIVLYTRVLVLVLISVFMLVFVSHRMFRALSVNYIEAPISELLRLDPLTGRPPSGSSAEEGSRTGEENYLMWQGPGPEATPSTVPDEQEEPGAWLKVKAKVNLANTELKFTTPELPGPAEVARTGIDEYYDKNSWYHSGGDYHRVAEWRKAHQSQANRVYYDEEEQ